MLGFLIRLIVSINLALFEMCINLANEQLHQLFTQYIFKQEIHECLDESIDMDDFVSYQDNQIILDLFLDVRLAGTGCLNNAMNGF
jgi:myosin heavy subunit